MNYLLLLSVFLHFCGAQVPSLQPTTRTRTKTVLDVSYIPTCCNIILGDDLTSNELLLGCVGQMTQLTRNYFLHNEPLYWSNVSYFTSLVVDKNVNENVPLVVVVVSILPKNVFNLHSSAFAINAAYAEHNKYLYYTMNQPPELLPSSSRRRSITTLMKDNPGNLFNGDIIFWMESDVVVTDMNWRIESLLSDENSDIDVFLFQDELDSKDMTFQQPNISCILSRNTAWSLQFFFMFDLYLYFNEEEVTSKNVNYIDSFLEAIPKDDLKKVKLLPTSLLFSSTPNQEHDDKSYPLLNLAREDHMYARSVFENGWEQVCGHTRRHNRHPNPAPFPVTERHVSPDESHDPLWSFVGIDETLMRVSAIDEYSFHLPPHIGLNSHKLLQLYEIYQSKYLEIQNMVARAKQLNKEKGDSPLPFRTINQMYQNLRKYIEVMYCNVTHFLHY